MLIKLMTGGHRDPAKLMQYMGVGPRRFLDICQMKSVRRFRRAELIAESILNGPIATPGPHVLELDADDIDAGEVIDTVNQALNVASRSKRASSELLGMLSPFTIRWIRDLADSIDVNRKVIVKSDSPSSPAH